MDQRQKSQQNARVGEIVAVLAWLLIVATILAAPWALAYARDHFSMSQDTRDLLNVLSGVGIVLEILAIPLIILWVVVGMFFWALGEIKMSIVKGILWILGVRE